jgi:predicted phosphohydrolase
MPLAFDLISDLHVETWSKIFNWTGQATSPFCVVVGDVAQDRNVLIKTLTHLGSCYQAVFYIDGNDEHRDYYDNLSSSYNDLAAKLKPVPNLVYLQNNVVVIEGVAILGTNGWWAFNFDLSVDSGSSVELWQDETGHDLAASQYISAMAQNDANYLVRSVKRLQKRYDVRHIVVATHTVPATQLLAHDIELKSTPKLNCMGNRYLEEALDCDTEKKIHTWCFGHYHRPIDQIYRQIRFVNNCRGKEKTDYATSVFYPKRIVVEN